MRILFIMDPISKLLLKWDNSLYLLRELAERMHDNWIADATEVQNSSASCRQVFVTDRPRRNKYRLSLPQRLDLRSFDLIIIRKEPPVDAAYLKMLRSLERISKQVPVVNHPRGIRQTNEKLSILEFSKWIPKTIVTSSPQTAFRFVSKLKKPVVVKPLDQKGGKGVFLLRNEKAALWRLEKASRKGRKVIMVQEFIPVTRAGEKRIVILNGEFLSAYEKRARGREFRANLGLGATFHNTRLTAREKKLITDLKPFLIKRGLYFVGIDVLEGKLIEINVTSPAGITETKFLNPKSRPVEAWADFLEDFALQRGRVWKRL